MTIFSIYLLMYNEVGDKMDIEEKIFKKACVNYDKLISYGFKKENEIYKYSKKMNNSFIVEITYDKKISGKIIDTNLNEEYYNFRIESQNGAFVNKIRDEYEKILINILDNCFDKLNFFSPQANRIADLIFKSYSDKPEFLFEKSPDCGVFRDENSNKWYAIIMNIDANKINKNRNGIVDIINVKLSLEKISELISRECFFKAYHMNKKNWVSIILDDTISDDEIMKYVEISHNFFVISNTWLIPANPKFYDVINCFNDEKIILWKQSNDIKISDIVYIYVASPYSQIMYKCEAVEVNIDYQYNDNNLSIKKAMRIKLLKKFNEKDWTFDKLNTYGINSIRGPRRIPENLKKELENYEKGL